MSNLPTLSPAQRRFLVWFTPAAWLVTNAITPVVYCAKLKHERVDPKQYEILSRQEICRQIVSGSIGFLTSVGGILLGSMVSKKTGAKTLYQMVGGTLANCFGFAVIRPIFGTDLFVRWARRKGIMPFQDANTATASPHAQTNPESGLQNFMRGMAERRPGAGFQRLA